MEKFNVSIAVTITRDGAEFSDYVLNYKGLSLAALQELQHAQSDMLLGLGDKRLPAAVKG